jgi:hypothetical protein
MYHIIVAKFASKCESSGTPIMVGEKILFKPSPDEGEPKIVCDSADEFREITRGWSESLVNEMLSHNMELKDDQKWMLFQHNNLVLEGTEAECLAYYHSKEIYSWTKYSGKLGYHLRRYDHEY